MHSVKGCQNINLYLTALIPCPILIFFMYYLVSQQGVSIGCIYIYLFVFLIMLISYITYIYKHLTYSNVGINGFYPERIQKEVTWNRTVNLNCGPGNNIAMDLANEFMNRDFKVETILKPDAAFHPP